MQNQQRLQKVQGIRNPRLLSLKDAAQTLGISLWGIRQRISAGDIPCVQFIENGKVYLDRKDLDALIDRHKESRY